jgi:polysaccharide pyruvyl transferase WcaK-like protein
MNPTTITFFGNFGTQNLGNECTLQAIIQNARRFSPDASVTCVCTNPLATSAAHAIPAFRISERYGDVGIAGSGRRHRNPVSRLIRLLFVRLPREVGEWVTAFRILKGTSMLVMTGTGMLGDFGIGPFDLHYEILKWAILARIRGCKLLFVSVGAGPIAHPLSRWIVKSALSLADYRSYRDEFSQRYLESIGFNSSQDRVCPDLAFSLATSEILPSADTRRNRNGRVVGLGLMEYYGQHRSPEEGERIYQRYVERAARFAAWLLERGYTVRLLVGDLSYDRRVKGDVRRLLEEKGWARETERIIDEPVSSAEELYAQLAQTDIVVATRFHNVLLALMLNRPVIALSYHEKFRSLMSGMGLADYCQDAADVDVPLLIEQFTRLEQNAEILSASMKQKSDEYRAALDEQYGRIFGDLRKADRPAATSDGEVTTIGTRAGGARHAGNGAGWSGSR